MRTIYLNSCAASAKLERYRKMADGLVEILESGHENDEKITMALGKLREEIEYDEETYRDSGEEGESKSRIGFQR